MIGNSLSIKRPFGISVFGSGLIRVSPDIAVIRAGVSHVNEKLAVAFSETRNGVQAVTSFLGKFGGLEYGTATVRLSAERRFIGTEQRFLGYRATVGIQVLLRRLEDLEQVVVGMVEAGANEIGSVSFQVSELKSLRAKARTMALESAREKGLLYAHAAGVELGKVIHVQDVNPEATQAWRTQPRGHGAAPENAEPDFEGTQSLDPAAIEVNAAVLVAYAIA